MSVRPQASSRDISPEAVEKMTEHTSIMQRLFPDTPKWTVIIAAAFPHDEEDIEMERAGDEGVPPICETQICYVRAVNVHTAIEMCMARVYEELTEEAEMVDFTLTVAAAFAGHMVDMSDDYDPEKSAFAHMEKVIEPEEAA